MTRRPNTAERRAEIVTGLLAVMAERGYDGASIGDIAASARLAPGLVHYHFSNKLEILVEATREVAADHERLLDRALGVTTSATAALDAIVDVHLGLGAHADPDRLACWIQIAGEAIRHPQIAAAYRAVIAGLANRIARVIENGIAVGELACDDPRAAGAALTAAIQGYFVMAATARDTIPRGSAAASARLMLQGLVRFVGPRAKPDALGHAGRRIAKRSVAVVPRGAIELDDRGLHHLTPPDRKDMRGRKPRTTPRRRSTR
jgi:TetR/AcrR family transcriptional repressor of bet genes